MVIGLIFGSFMEYCGSLSPLTLVLFMLLSSGLGVASTLKMGVERSPESLVYNKSLPSGKSRGFCGFVTTGKS